jgi:hypothetical protein
MTSQTGSRTISREPAPSLAIAGCGSTLVRDLGGDSTTTLTRLLMPACDRVTGPAQVLCQVFLHLGCGLVGHRVQMLIAYPRKSIRRCGVFLLVLLSFPG